MRLNPLQMERLAGEEEYAAGRELEETGSVKIGEQDSSMIRYIVAGKPPQAVILSSSLTLYCGCQTFLQRGCCRHAVAAWLAAERAGIPESMLKKSAPRKAEELTDLILRQMPSEANIRLEVTLVLPQKPGQEVRLGLRIGENKLYVCRDIRAFLTAMDTGETIPFGKDFTYQPEWMKFSDDDERVLNILRKLFSVRAAEERTSTGGTRLIHLPDSFTRELLDNIGETPLRIMDSNGETIRCKQIRRTRVPLQFEMNLGARGLRTAARIPADLLPVTEDCTWVVTGGRLIQTEPNQRELVRLIWNNQYEGRCLFEYPLAETDRVIGEVLPYLKLRGAVEMSSDLNRRLVRMPLKTEVYLDRDGKSVVASVQFHYGDIMLNPFAPVEKKITLDKGEKLLLRDAEGEHLTLEILANAGFRVRKENIRLSGSEEIFDFVSEGVRKLQEVSDVFLSREFKRILPRRPVLSGSMRMNGEKLELMLRKDGEPVEELLELIEALSR